MAETFLRDLRIGLRVLVKEKSFCALAVIVLALGICGVTTMFSVVNGVMLRGFSFPNAARLASANFIDPSSANFFGVNGQISSMDFDELLPQQQSFEMLASYLNGSTVNMAVNGHPAALHRRLRHREFSPHSRGCRRCSAATSPPPTTSPAPRRSRSSATASGSATSAARPGHRRQRRPDQRQAGHDHRRDAEGLRLPDQRGAVDAAVQRVPAEAAERSAQLAGPCRC